MSQEKLQEALFDAATRNNTKKITEAINNGADIDAIDGSGETALFQAARMNNVRASKLLLSAGANAYIINNRGDTALDIARSWYNKDVVKVFVNYSSNRKPLKKPVQAKLSLSSYARKRRNGTLSR